MDEFERYAAKLRTVAVTGTNGKTTTTSMIAAIVATSGETSARVTTVGSWVGDELLDEEGTVEGFVRVLRSANAMDVRTLAVETTSKALAEGFAHHWQACVAVFTNLSHDHLDYHGTPEKYLAAKAQLFMTLPDHGVAVLNGCDEASELLSEVTPSSVRRLVYGSGPARVTKLHESLWAEQVAVDRNGTRITLTPGVLADRLGRSLQLKVVGAVYAENAMAAALATDALGYTPEAISRGLASFPGVEGRFQIIGQTPMVVVDYAHTPDALQRTLLVARELAEAQEGHVICVFGCGGDRDAAKRGTMGKVASELADVAIITTDNPRGEDPRQIADAIALGAAQGRGKIVRQEDRRAAIEMAIRMAEDRDVVLVAGRGGERFQEIAGERLVFPDVEVAREVCAQRLATSPRLMR